MKGSLSPVCGGIWGERGAHSANQRTERPNYVSRTQISVVEKGKKKRVKGAAGARSPSLWRTILTEGVRLTGPFVGQFERVGPKEELPTLILKAVTGSLRPFFGELMREITQNWPREDLNKPLPSSDWIFQKRNRGELDKSGGRGNHGGRLGEGLGKLLNVPTLSGRGPMDQRRKACEKGGLVFRRLGGGVLGLPGGTLGECAFARVKLGKGPASAKGKGDLKDGCREIGRKEKVLSCLQGLQ